MTARAIAFLVLLSGCADKGSKLTDEQVVKYIAAYKNLKAAGPELADQARKGAGLVGKAGVDEAVTKAGFTSYAEFVKVNAKVAWAFSNGQATAFMDDTATKVSDGEKQLQAAIADPNTPEAAKGELRQALTRMRADYAKNKGYADVAMSVSDKLTDKEDVATVMRHKAELEAAFQGR